MRRCGGLDPVLRSGCPFGTDDGAAAVGVLVFVPSGGAGHQDQSLVAKRPMERGARALNVKEGNLIDLAADLTLPRDAVRSRLRDLAAQREKLTDRLGGVVEDLGVGVALIDACLTLLEDPQELYSRCDDEQRRTLNQACFAKLLIEEDNVSAHIMQEPFAELLTVQRTQNLIAGGMKDPDKVQKLARQIHSRTPEKTKEPPSGWLFQFPNS